MKHIGNKFANAKYMYIFVCVLIVCFILSACEIPIYETNDIADYGNITGNYNNERPYELIFSFFPAQIEDYFSDVTYHYKAKKFDTIGCEAYLEFVIDDKTQFAQYIEQLEIPQDKITHFQYDRSYYEYDVMDKYWFFVSEDRVCYESAHLGKILYSEEQQRIIFWALLVEDGGGTNSDDLHYYFDRFGIDPNDYVEAQRIREGYA